MKKVLLVILDGFGLRDEIKGNAVIAANPNNFNTLWKKYSHAKLEASGPAVGLLEGQFGNSEIGHMTIGAGRKIKQNIDLIHELLDGNILENELFKELIESKKTIHLMGLLSDGKVHSDIEHLLKLYEHLVKAGANDIVFHVITDGRDTSRDSALTYLDKLQAKIDELKVGYIATICGRYTAMDRNNNWDRTKQYFDLVTAGKGNIASSYKQAIDVLYKKEIYDEFLPPILLNKNGLIKKDDILFWVNYRTDRAKQIIGSMVNNEFDAFDNSKILGVDVYSFVKIDKNIKTKFFVEERKITRPMGLYLSELGLSQARIAETEKYAHVTYFFDGEYNGNIEKGYRYLIPSPNVATYDLKPEMSAVEVTKKVIACMQRDFDFILVNYANPDMVGHTGNMDATVKAVMSVDLCLGKIVEEAENNFYTVVVMADHGNADIMIDENDEPVTTHTLSKVPFIICDEKVELMEEGTIADVAPTILSYMDIAIPEEMEESNILIKESK